MAVNIQCVKTCFNIHVCWLYAFVYTITLHFNVLFDFYLLYCFGGPWSGMAPFRVLTPLGCFCLIWLGAIHVKFIRDPELLLEMSPTCLGVFYAPTSFASPDSLPQGMTEKLYTMGSIFYKQTTAAKQSIILWEEGPQTAAALVYSYFVPPSAFVLALNVVLPIAKYAFAKLANKPMRPLMRPWLDKQMVQAVTDGSPEKTAQYAAVLDEDGELLRLLEKRTIADSVPGGQPELVVDLSK